LKSFDVRVYKNNRYSVSSKHPTFESAFDSWKAKLLRKEYTKPPVICIGKDVVFTGYKEGSKEPILDIEEAKRSIRDL